MPIATGNRLLFPCAPAHAIAPSVQSRSATAPLVISVDGPAASGKGTIAKALAAHFGLPFMDTGKLYRACGLAVRLAGRDPYDAAAAAAAAHHITPGLLADPDLMSSLNSEYASIVSSHPAVRAALLETQQAFARQPGGAVLDGRDIGTVIAPHAPAKLFVTASPAVRAARRHAELAGRGGDQTIADVLADIAARDARDSGRSAAPLRRAPDAALLDTSDLGIDAAVGQAIRLVEEALARRGPHSA
jgi:cytidylate kinase